MGATNDKFLSIWAVPTCPSLWTWFLGVTLVDRSVLSTVIHSLLPLSASILTSHKASPPFEPLWSPLKWVLGDPPIHLPSVSLPYIRRPSWLAILFLSTTGVLAVSCPLHLIMATSAGSCRGRKEVSVVIRYCQVFHPQQGLFHCDKSLLNLHHPLKFAGGVTLTLLLPQVT